MRTTTLLALSLFGCLPLQAGPRIQLPEGPPPVTHGIVVDEALSAQLDAEVLGGLEQLGLVGLSLGVTIEGRVVHTAGYGWAELETERALTPDTPVLLSSVSKTFIGIAAMQAVEAGALQLDDEVAGLVPFAIDNPHVDDEVLTLRHLLTHNGALVDGLAYLYAYGPGDPVVGLGDFLEAYLVPGGATYQRRNYARRSPGTGFAYSNVGAALAGYAIGQARGLEFSDLVRRDILEPLGMTHSGYLLSELSEPPAVPYKNVGGGAFRPFEHYSYPTYPDGLMRSSAGDMARYLAAVQGGGELDGVQILSEASVEQMLTVDPSYGTDEGGQAIIWSQAELGSGRVVIGHNGGDFGSLTELRTDRQTGTGVVLLLASMPRRGEDWARLFEIQDALHALGDTWEGR